MSAPLPSLPGGASAARAEYARRSSKEDLLSNATSTPSTPSPALPAIPAQSGGERGSQPYREMRDLTAPPASSSYSAAYSGANAPRLASSSPEHLHISHSATQLPSLVQPSPSKPAFTDSMTQLDSASLAPRSSTPNSSTAAALDADRERSLELERERERAVGLGLGRIEESPSAASLPPRQSENRSTPSRQDDREEEDSIPVGFDEGILKGLCELDVSTPPHTVTKRSIDLDDQQCGMPLLVDRMKQTMASCRVRLFLHCDREHY